MSLNNAVIMEYCSGKNINIRKAAFRILFKQLTDRKFEMFEIACSLTNQWVFLENS